MRKNVRMRMMTATWAGLIIFLSCISWTSGAYNPPERTEVIRPAFEGQTQRPLRYHPDGTDFVIENGKESFNRPLYGGNTAFRIDAGDRPESILYLPGRGGNLRFGFKTPITAKWLFEADKIISRYRPSSMVYEIHDTALGDNILTVTLLTTYDMEGMVCSAELKGKSKPVELIIAFGGADGKKGKRGGDIGCESKPVSEFFQLTPENCKSNAFTIHANTFKLQSKPGIITGVLPADSVLTIYDAAKWDSLNQLLQTADSKTDTPVLVGRIPLMADKVVYFELHRPGTNDRTPDSEKLSQLFNDTEKIRKSIAEQVKIETPDAYINATMSAVCTAADAIWDEPQGVVMHGAVAWRTKLPGWRGPYANDALGWHERSKRHLTYWAGQQNTKPVQPTIPPADPTSNLSRNEPALHTNGDIANKHYDMNLVYIDALFRHILWTGDMELAHQMWPTIERHLAWERRLFRRTFGPDKLPLYEAYCCIWASDDLQYSGGGVTHASAYNYYHNCMAARLAKLLSKDSTPYQQEANLILKAMNQYLWLEDTGCWAEWKDLLGLQKTHPAAALWTIYHTMDSEVPTPLQAWQMMHYVDTQIAHIPIHGPGVPQGDYFTLPTSNWMPYTWSTNNVVMAEAAHTALAYWQANRAETAFCLFKGCLLDSMYQGLCPGNLGMTTYFDSARGEAQRDFADAVGVCSRAIVEGLFGIRPDIPAGQLTICPGFPKDWGYARIKHPDITFVYERKDNVETYTITPHFAKPVSLRLTIPSLLTEIKDVTINGQSEKWTKKEPLGRPHIEIQSPAQTHWQIVIAWEGQEPVEIKLPTDKATLYAVPEVQSIEKQKANPMTAKLDTVDLTSIFNDKVTQIFRNEYLSPRSPYCSLAIPKQGIGSWCNYEKSFDVDDSGLRKIAGENNGTFKLPQGIPFKTPGTGDAKNIAFTSQWDNYPNELTTSLSGKACHIYLLMAGSTNSMQSQFDNGEVTVTYTDGTTQRLALRNPTTWWPIDQDYFIDDYGFRYPGTPPPRVDLKTGLVRISEKGKGGTIPGGAATVLDMPLDLQKELKSLTVRALANEVVIGLMSATLVR